MEEIENHIFLRSRPLKSVIKTLEKAETKGVIAYHISSFIK